MLPPALSGLFRVLPFVILLTPVLGGSILNFPRLAFDEGTFTGLAFVNPTSAPATITLTAYGPDGRPVSAPGFRNPSSLSIPAGQQVARVLLELFLTPLPPDFYGWIQATSETDHITGFFLYLDSSIRFLDGAELPRTGNSIVFHSTRSENGFQSELDVINPNLSPSHLTLQLYRPGLPRLTSSAPLVLPAMGMARLAPGNLFGISEFPVGTYLVVDSDTAIAGFELIRRTGGDLFGINARPDYELMRRLYFPQFAVLGPWKTTLTLINSSDQTVLLTLTVLNSQGEPFPPGVILNNPVVRSLQGGTSLTSDVAELFGFGGSATQIGWLKVESTAASIQGFISYGLPEAGSVAAVSAQFDAQTEFLFSHLATDLGYFTGLALLNPGTLSTNFRVLALNPQGQVLGRFHGVLGGGERLSKVIQELVPAAAGKTGGFIWVQSDLPLYGTSLFGTDRVLANIPSQASPASFVPDLSLPSPQVQPRMVVLQPGASQQFASSNFPGAVDWTVNGQTGGTPALGRIDANGRYTAPFGLTQPLSVDVSAVTGTAAAGASVDLFFKQDLVSGLGTVQSAAYLASLAKIYTAEITGFGLQAGRGLVPAAGSGESRIFSAYPNRLQIKTFPGEFIAKMIPFVSSSGHEYLLLAAREGGRILRLNPLTGESVAVIQGLTGPTALALDPSNGNLLVADQDRIKSFPLIQLEAGLLRTERAQVPIDSVRAQQIGGFDRLVGLAVDACTGDLYVSEEAGRLLAVDGVSGEVREVDAGRRLTSLLGLYRLDVPCPAAFHLLAAEPADSKVDLFVPSSGIATTWLDGATITDLTLLPEANTTGPSASILLGGSSVDSPSGTLTLVPVPDLYEAAGTVPVAPVLSHEDPRGDTLGPAGGPRYDIVRVDAEIRNGELLVTVALKDPFDILTLDSEGTELTVGIEMDVDQNPATGVQPLIDFIAPYDSGLGVEFGVETEVDPTSHTVPLYRLTSSGAGVPIANLPIQVEAASLTVPIPLERLGAPSCVKLVVEAGYYDWYDEIVLTDVAPNIRHITACPR